MIEAHEDLLRKLRQYAAVASQAEMELALLGLHTGLEDVFRAYLRSKRYDEVHHQQTSFPQLVNLIADHTDLFEGDSSLPRSLKRLNRHRRRIAHPREGKPSPQQIASDAEQMARLIRRFWPGLFGEPCPYTAVAPRLTSKPRGDQPPRSSSKQPDTRSPSFWSKLSQPLRSLWRDESETRFRVGRFIRRLIGIVTLLAASGWSKRAAINTARWPEPIKYVGVALFFAALGLFLWALLVLWRLLRQLRLRGLIILLGFSSILLISVSVLTSPSALPIHQEVLSSAGRLGREAGREARDLLQSLVQAPGEFRFAYTGERRPLPIQQGELEGTFLLTPIPANDPVRPRSAVAPLADASEPLATRSARAPSPPSATATPAPVLRLPDCPHPQARLTAPRVNQVVSEQVQAQGTANIEDFDYYKFEIRREDGAVQDEWHWIGSFETPVEEGVLGNLSLSALPEGDYALRLIVVNREGNYPFPPCEVKIRIRR